MSELPFRPYEPGDEQAILDTFNRVFAEVCGEGYVDRKMEEWRWIYQENPCGNRILLAMADDGRVAAQYAGVPLPAHTLLGPTQFVHAVDSMVHPEFRKGLKKPGLFVRLGREWFDWVGRLGHEAVCYGYPVRTAYRMGARYMSYELSQDMLYLVGELDQVRPVHAQTTGIEVEENLSFPEEEVEALWQGWHTQWDCTILRNKAYLDWRYIQCPSKNYLGLLARKQGKLVGLAVISPVHELIPGALTFAEWMVLPGHEDAGCALIHAALRLARENDRQRLMTVLAPWCREFAFFREQGFQSVHSKVYLERKMVSFLFKERFTPAWLAKHWYIALGDTDLV